MNQLGISKSRSILGSVQGNGKNIIHGRENLKISLNNVLNGFHDEIVDSYHNGPAILAGEGAIGASAFQRQLGKKNKFNCQSTTGNNMDLLKKFRYNFNYWLKNCYQPQISMEEHNKEIYQTTNASNAVADQIYQLAKNKSYSVEQ